MPKINVPQGVRIKYSRHGKDGQEKQAYRFKRFFRAYFGNALKVRFDVVNIQQQQQPTNQPTHIHTQVELDPNDGYGSQFVVKDSSSPEEFYKYSSRGGCVGTSRIMTYPPSDRKMTRMCTFLENRGVRPSQGHPRSVFAQDDMCQIPVCRIS